MKKPSNILCFVFMGVGIFGGFRAFAEDKDKLPVLDIVNAIIDSEIENQPDADRPPVVGEGVQWDPYAMPEATQSWLMLDTPPEAYERMENNQDQHGKPLF